MKNYEVKYATKEFALAGTASPKLVNKRLAYLVPNMFGKMKTGFVKKVSGIVAVYQDEVRKVEVVEPVPAPIIEEVKPQVQPSIQTQVQQPTSAVVEKAPVSNSKNYSIKAYLADLNEIKNNNLLLKSAPKKLLISTYCRENIFANYIKHKEVEARGMQQVASSPEQKQQQAVSEYIALNNEMKILIKKVEEIKAQMVTLAKDHGLTRSMVEKAMQTN